MLKSRLCLLVIPLCLAVGEASWGADSIKTAKSVLSGHVVGVTPTNVNLEQGGTTTAREIKEIPVNQIITVFFESEPAEFKTAKTKAAAGHFAEAMAALERIKGDVARAEIRQDIEYYKVLCSARLALAGSGDVAEAGRGMKAYIEANPQSFHYYEGVELLGDMLASARQYPQAAEYYAQLEKTPWPDYKMRAGIAAGRILLAQGKNEEAIAAFEKVISAEGSGELIDTQRVSAKLGKASVLLAAGKNDEAVKFLDDFLQKANPEDERSLARAYNQLGTAHRQAGEVKDALLAFLRVDMLYSSVADAHAEALSNLADLWEQSHKPDRAQRARRTLEENYQDSPWAKKR